MKSKYRVIAMGLLLVTVVLAGAFFYVKKEGPKVIKKEITREIAGSELKSFERKAAGGDIDIGKDKILIADVKITSKEEIKGSVTKELKDKAEKEEPAKEITEKGVIYELKDVKWEDKSLQVDREYTDYSTSEVPNTISENGQELKIDSISESVRPFAAPFTVSGTFYADDSTEYILLRGNLIDIENAPEFENYKGEIALALGLDTNTYRLDGGAWNGSYYEQNGESLRNATFNGYRSQNVVSVRYAKPLFEGVATYQTNGGRDIAKLSMEVSYTKDLRAYEKGIGAALGVALFGLLVSLVLMVIARKKKNDEE